LRRLDYGDQEFSGQDNMSAPDPASGSSSTSGDDAEDLKKIEQILAETAAEPTVDDSLRVELHPLIEESITDLSYMREDRFSIYLLSDCFPIWFSSQSFPDRRVFVPMIQFFSVTSGV
jgi:hypothetical protein